MEIRREKYLQKKYQFKQHESHNNSSNSYDNFNIIFHLSITCNKAYIRLNINFSSTWNCLNYQLLFFVPKDYTKVTSKYKIPYSDGTSKMELFGNK